jgi:hypothetical protein
MHVCGSGNKGHRLLSGGHGLCLAYIRVLFGLQKNGPHHILQNCSFVANTYNLEDLTN